MTTGARWYAVAVHARSEHRVARALAERVDEVFLPTRVERRAWSDRVRTTDVVLFPGYCFVRLALTPERRHALLKVDGVVDFVGRTPGDARVARSVDDDEIASLQTLVAAERALDPLSRLVEGTPVVVAQGALRGVRGVVEQSADGQRRLAVQVMLLGRGVRVVLAADDVVATIADAA